MKRKCKICNTVTKEDLLIVCPECGADFNSGEPDRMLLTAQQEKYIVSKIWQKHWKLIFGGFSIIGVISLVLLFFTIVGLSKSATSHLEKILVDRVSKEFELPRIQVVVSNVATEQASYLMAEQITPEVTKFKADIAIQLKELNSLVKKTRILEVKSRQHEKSIQGVLTTLIASRKQIDEKLAQASAMRDDLQEISDYNLLIVRALGDDIVAWDILGTNAQNSAYRFHTEARQLYASIQCKFVGQDTPSYIVLPPEIQTIAKTSSRSVLESLSDKWPNMYHTHLIAIAWNRSDLSKFEKLSFIAYVLENTKSMTARVSAGKHFASESKRYFGHLRKDEWLEWWKANKDRIKKELDRKDRDVNGNKLVPD